MTRFSRKILRRVALAGAVIACALVVLAAVLIARTFAIQSTQGTVEAATDRGDVDSTAIAKHLSEAIRFKTVSAPDQSIEAKSQFVGLKDYLARTFPKCYATLTVEHVNEYSLLFTWKGVDAGLKPVMLTAHLDVVPAADPPGEGARGDGKAGSGWIYPPFEGRIDETFIWGRGSLDDKVSVLGILEAAESLIAQGFQPRRTIYFGFGQDEETSGVRGARAIAARLKARGIRLECVVDEGTGIVDQFFPGLSAPVAPIGIAEKGYADVELKVQAPGGHSSMPPAHSAIGVLAQAIVRVEGATFPARLEGASRQALEVIGPEMPFGERLLFANLWLFGPIVAQRLTASPASDALVRTTTAVTLVQGGAADNVMPTSARAVVNFRVLPGETVDGVLKRVRTAVDDPKVEVSFAAEAEPLNPSRLSSDRSSCFATLRRSIRQIYPEAKVVPFLGLASTDARNYEDISDDVYRFLPIRLASEDLDRIHGTNERISKADYTKVVRFYRQFIRNISEPEPEPSRR
jgi:carboxypeptidase PM20D1